jgi:hypothetical protein
MKSVKRRTAALFACLLTGAAWAEFRVTLEEPVDAGTASGVSNIRGWAVSDEGIDRVELFVNGQYAFEIPYGGLREDVEQAFPAIPGSRFSGFGQTYNYGSLGAGEHTMMIRVHDGSGAIREDSARFSVVGFPDSFLSAGESPDLSRADAELNRATGVVTLDDVRQDGREYDLQLVWSTAAQAFVMQSLGPSLDDDGRPDDDREVEFQGVVSALEPGVSITVAGATYAVSERTLYFIDNVGSVSADTFFGRVAIGSTVEVTDYLPTDGVADELYLEDLRD